MFDIHICHQQILRESCSVRDAVETAKYTQEFWQFMQQSSAGNAVGVELVTWLYFRGHVQD